MWQPLFEATNAVALGGWLVLLAGPRRWLPAVRYGAVGLLCAIYVVLFAVLIGGWVDPVRVAGTSGSFTGYSVRGLRALFAADGAIVVGWTHYLALDLFVGAWIAEDADRADVSRRAQAPILLLTVLAGPAGLLAWFAVRASRRP